MLVTHDMEMVQRFCHRAMLITDGEIEMIGDPGEVGRRYLERNFESYETTPRRSPARTRQAASARAITEVWLENDRACASTPRRTASGCTCTR